MAVMYNVHRNEMTDGTFIEGYIMIIVWLLRIYMFIVRYHYIMCTCIDL